MITFLFQLSDFIITTRVTYTRQQVKVNSTGLNIKQQLQ